MMDFLEASANQVCVKLSAIGAGELTLQEKIFLTDPAPETKWMVPSLSFLIQHGDTKVIFDGGLAPDDARTALRKVSWVTSVNVRSQLAVFICNQSPSRPSHDDLPRDHDIV